MSIVKQFIIVVLFILFGCGLFEADPEPLEPIDTYFYAEINGEPFNASRYNAGIEDTNTDRYFLEFGGSQYLEEFPAYSEKFSFSLIYEEGITRYPLNIDTVLTEEVGFNIPSASYSESDWDVVISRFEISYDSESVLTVELEVLDDGRTTISGTFEMTVYLSFRIDTPFPQTEQDTLVITNGRYQLLLDDRRND